MIKTYLSCEVVQAEPMSELDFIKQVKLERPDRLQKLLLRGEGYKVTYSDRVVTWVAKETFERFFREINQEEEKLIVQSVISTNEHSAV